MSKIERYAGNLRAFGSNAQGLERTLFGETSQADDLTSQVTAAFLRGWGIVGPSENPSLEDFNAAMYTMSQFIAYQHQMGIPEWDAAQEYYKGSLCVRGGETYSSLVDDNIGSAPPSAKWTPVLTSKNGLTYLGLLGGINSSAVGRLLNVQKISSSQAYTKTPGAKFVVVEAVGGGGAGGSPAQNGSGYTSGSGGGNSGCYVRFLVDLSSVDSVSCIIGAGGKPVAQQEGGMGGNTAFGSYATVLGGNGGLLLASATSTNRIYGMSPPRGGFGSINNAVLLDYNYGGLGGDALIMSSGARAGVGGASKLGDQTFGPGNDTPGINAATYGGGGSGVVATSATQGTNLLGGNGAGGVIIVWEYA